MRRQTTPPVAFSASSFNLSRALGSAIAGLLATLVGTGIVSMIVLYSHVSTLTDAQTRTEQTLQRHLDHSVDRDEYLRRDAAVQKAIDNMATKDDLRQLRDMILDVVSSNASDPRGGKYYRRP